MARTVLFAALGFLVFLVVGYIVSLIVVFFGGDLMGVSQAEGAFAMMVAFTIAPALALISGIVGAVLAVRWARRRADAQGD